MRLRRRRRLVRKYTATFQPPKNKYILLTGKVFIIVGVVLLLFLGGVLFSKSPYLRVQEVRVTGIPCHASRQEYDSLCSVKPEFEGASLLLLSKEKVQKKVLETDFRIKEVEVIKEYPHTLRLQVMFRTPLMAIPLKVEEKEEENTASKEASTSVQYRYYHIDEEGYIISTEATSSSLPIYVTEFQQDVGKRLQGEEVLMATKLIQRLKSRGIDVTSLVPEVEALKVTLTSGGIVYFDIKKDIDFQVASLQLILQNFTIERKDFQIIDLRYEKPIAY